MTGSNETLGVHGLSGIPIPGLLVGHAEDPRALTGVTAVLCPQGAVGGYAIRGGAVGARELGPLEPGTLAPVVHGICLAGGSAFGLDAAGGVVRFLEEQGVGFMVRGHRIPLVPTAILFDLGIGDGLVRPNAAMGYQAAKSASSLFVAEGNVGAGCGATCGKLFGIGRATKSGLGVASRVSEDGLAVFALVAANPLGDIVDPVHGRPIAGLRDSPDGRRLCDSARIVRQGGYPWSPSTAPENTSLGIVATNAALDKLEATKVAQLAADALPRVIAPACTLADGDIVFALSLGSRREDLHRVGLLARDCLEEAIVRAARSARAAGGLPAACDLEVGAP